MVVSEMDNKGRGITRGKRALNTVFSTFVSEVLMGQVQGNKYYRGD